jgi:hypothetical protein
VAFGAYEFWRKPSNTSVLDTTFAVPPAASAPSAGAPATSQPAAATKPETFGATAPQAPPAPASTGDALARRAGDARALAKAKEAEADVAARRDAPVGTRAEVAGAPAVRNEVAAAPPASAPVATNALRDAGVAKTTVGEQRATNTGAAGGAIGAMRFAQAPTVVECYVDVSAGAGATPVMHRVTRTSDTTAVAVGAGAATTGATSADLRERAVQALRVRGDTLFVSGRAARKVSCPTP